MEPADIDRNLQALDGRGTEAEWQAVRTLAALGERFPELLLEKYRKSKKWGERASCVYHATKYSRGNAAAYQLGLEALTDRSKYVRYRACLLLSVAQRMEAVSALKELLADSDSSDDARAAIDALKHGDQNLFVDRHHSGKIRLNVAGIVS